MAFLSGKQILAVCGTIVLVSTLSVPFLSKGESIGKPDSCPLSATILEWGMTPSLPGDFLESPDSIGRGLLKVKVRLRGLTTGVHPGYFLMDRINGAASRETRLEQAGPSLMDEHSGELWDYKVLGQPNPLKLPSRGECYLELRFVVPLGFRGGVLDFRGRSLARLGK